MTHPIRFATALALTLTCTFAQAEEFDGVRADSLLSDADFFRLATCGASPGGNCRLPTIRWPTPSVSVALLPGDSPGEIATSQRIAPILDAAIASINAVAAGITLTRVTGEAAEIRIYPTDMVEGTEVEEVPGLTAPGIMGVGYVTLWSNDTDDITAASILFSSAITDDDLPSVVLEELYQSLGPRFDVEGPAYEGVSIVSQTSNATTMIEGQDAVVLRMLYPPKE